MSTLQTTPPRTVCEILEQTAAAHGAAPAMATKEHGSWRTYTWSEYRSLARKVARGLIQLGLEPGRGVSIIGNNRPEWILADVGAILAGGFPAGIYATNTAEQCHYIAEHSDSQIAVVEDAAQLAKFISVWDRLPALAAVVMMQGSSDNPRVHSWQELLVFADQVEEAKLEERIAAQNADDVCTLIYTSGTTADPKGVMLTHDNLTWTALSLTTSLADSVHRTHGHDEFAVDNMSYLPLSHIAEQMNSIHAVMSYGGCASFAENLDKLGDNLRERLPTIFFGVPRVWEKIQAKIIAAAHGNNGLKKKIAAWARQVGLQGGYAEQQGQSKSLMYKLANRLIFTKVRQALGMNRAVITVSSAAPISKDTLEFFLSLGLPIFEVYGMSECTGPGTLSLPDRYRTAKAGCCLPGAELKVTDDGEICMRGRHVFKGYYKDPATTDETIDTEGWLHSGDLGRIDADGFLEVTGRMKDLIITAGGKNIAPAPIEDSLKGIDGVSQAVVIGDRRPYLIALLTLDAEKLASAASKAGSPAKEPASASQCKTFRAYVQKQIDAINGRLARVQTVKKFMLLADDFTVDTGELTPTMKIKRRVINEKLAGEIDALYG